MFFNRFSVLACFVFFTFFVASASVQAAGDNIVVVDFQRISSESSAAKSIQDQLEKQREAFQKEFSEHERKLREEEKKIIEKRGDMSAEELSEKRQAFEAKLLETRKLVQERRGELERAAGKALNTLRQETVTIVAEMADKNEYDIVLGRQNVILAAKEKDITQEVMKKLNKKLKKVDLEISKK